MNSHGKVRTPMGNPNIAVSLLSGAPTEKNKEKARPLSRELRSLAHEQAETVVNVWRDLSGSGVEAVVSRIAASCAQADRRCSRTYRKVIEVVCFWLRAKLEGK